MPYNTNLSATLVFYLKHYQTSQHVEVVVPVKYVIAVVAPFPAVVVFVIVPVVVASLPFAI